MGCWWRQRVWEGRKHFFFVNKKEAKKTSVLRAVASAGPTPAGAKVFCFPGRGAFFSKNKRFFS
jgi:hypothetical protein